MATGLYINDQITIPRSELRFSFVRSSGPGGQNVNKVASKAVLHWAVTSSSAIPEDVRARFASRNKRRINEDGELVITSQRYRDQRKNIDDCLDKVRQLVLESATRPRRRKKTRPSAASRENRLQAKRIRAQKKQRRTPPTID